MKTIKLDKYDYEISIAKLKKLGISVDNIDECAEIKIIIGDFISENELIEQGYIIEIEDENGDLIERKYSKEFEKMCNHFDGREKNFIFWCSELNKTEQEDWNIFGWNCRVKVILEDGMTFEDENGEEIKLRIPTNTAECEIEDYELSNWKIEEELYDEVYWKLRRHFGKYFSPPSIYIECSYKDFFI